MEKTTSPVESQSIYNNPPLEAIRVVVALGNKDRVIKYAKTDSSQKLEVKKALAYTMAKFYVDALYKKEEEKPPKQPPHFKEMIYYFQEMKVEDLYDCYMVASMPAFKAYESAASLRSRIIWSNLTAAASLINNHHSSED